MDIMCTFYGPGAVITLCRDGDGSWAVEKAVGHDSYRVLTSAEYRYAADAFNAEIRLLEDGIAGSVEGARP